ncbi:MAG TPA: hypothetical protein VIQ01_08795 [Burkholderiales bacterium]
MQRIYTTVLLLCAVLSGCATHMGQRDAAGNPDLQRLSAAQLAERAAQAPAKLGVAEVAALARQGQSSNEIVSRMRASGSRLNMDAEQQSVLRKLGVSEAVIDALVTAEAEARRTDRITADVDRAATRKQAAEARREMYRSYAYDPYPYGMWYPYFGYGRFGHHSGWHSGIGWGWGGWGW